MSPLWYPNVKQAPLQGLTGMWGGTGSNLVSGGGAMTITQHYNASTPAGIVDVKMNNGSIKEMNYSTYNSMGWVEVMCYGDVPYGVQYNVPGWCTGDSTNGYTLTSYRDNSGELNYSPSGGYVGSHIVTGSLLTTTDMVITSKANVSSSTISPATGQNEASVLPLRLNADLKGPQAAAIKTAYLQYFRGSRIGFSHHYNGPEGPSYFNGAWQKSPSPYNFAGLFHHRDGSIQLDHWCFADGQADTPSTYSPNIGFRGTQESSSYSGKNVGSWSDGTDLKSDTYKMDASNVFSVWVTDMT